MRNTKLFEFDLLGSYYAHTKRGWFEMRSFTLWFKKVFLKKTKHLTGKKVLIGDNLGSHFSTEVSYGKLDIYTIISGSKICYGSKTFSSTETA